MKLMKKGAFLLKLMKKTILNYSHQLLESSSIKKLSQMFEYQVLDTRAWKH